MEWTVIIEPTLDSDLILQAIYLIPNYFQFDIYTDQTMWNTYTSSTKTYSSGPWQNFILPSTDNTIIIFDGRKRNVQFGGGTVGTRIGIAIFGNETLEQIYLRIYHELLHALQLPADDMTTNHDFVTWLTNMLRLALWLDKRFAAVRFAHNPKWQSLYYDFLLLSYLEKNGQLK